MTGAEVLELAAELIEREGWWQQGEGAMNGVCADIALACVAESKITALNEAEKAVVEYLGLPGHPPHNIFNWNDAPGRTSEQVCRMLRSVAAKLDGRYGPSDRSGSTDRDYGDEDPSWEVRDYTPEPATEASFAGPALSDPFYG